MALRQKVTASFAHLATLACLACATQGTALRPEAAVAQADPPPAVTQENRPGVGVWPLRNGGSYGADAEDYDRLEVGLQQLLIGELAANSALRIVDRSYLREAMAEQEIPADRVDAATAARMGRIVGAKYMILGGFTDLYGRFRLDVRIVDTETTEVLDAMSLEDDREEILDMVVSMAAMVAERADLPPLPADVREVRERAEAPFEAVTLFSQVQELQDLGLHDDATALLESLVDDFPNFVAAREALEQSR